METDSNEVFLEKDDDGRLLAVQGVKDGKRILLQINKDNIGSIHSFPFGQGEADKALREYLQQSPIDRTSIILKVNMEDIEKNLPKEEGKALSIADFTPAWLSEHVVDLHRYVSITKTEVEPKTNVYHALDERKINREQLLQELGINIDSLRESGDLDKMLNFGRSRIITSYPVIAGVCFPMQVKLSLREKGDGTLAVIPHPIKLEPNLNEYRGYRFTDEDRQNLLTTGNLGHTITIDSRLLGYQTEVYLSLDKETNELVALSKKSLRIPDCIKGVELTETQKQTLESGGSIYLSGMKSSTGQPFDAYIQVNAERRSLVFKNPAVKEDQKLQISNRLLGKEITDDIKNQWKEGKWVYLENMLSKDGTTFSAYVRPNFEKNKFEFSKTLPSNLAGLQKLQSHTQQAIEFLEGLKKERASLGRGEKGPLTKIADEKIREFDKQKKMKL